LAHHSQPPLRQLVLEQAQEQVLVLAQEQELV
jgi:hypothetical protein